MLASEDAKCRSFVLFCSPQLFSDYRQKQKKSTNKSLHTIAPYTNKLLCFVDDQTQYQSTKDILLGMKNP